MINKFDAIIIGFGKAGKTVGIQKRDALLRGRSEQRRTDQNHSAGDFIDGQQAGSIDQKPYSV